MPDPSPRFTDENRNGRLRTTLHVSPGERIKLCRCMKSADMPFCDGVHKTIDTTAGPIIVIVDETTPSADKTAE